MQSNKNNNKQANKLYANRTWQHYACESEPKPPWSGKGLVTVGIEFGDTHNRSHYKEEQNGIQEYILIESKCSNI